MTSPTPLRDALLELGLEDLIPLPEILATPEVNQITAEYLHIQKVSAALIETAARNEDTSGKVSGLRSPNIFPANRLRLF
jgi:hypothetical protein